MGKRNCKHHQAIFKHYDVHKDCPADINKVKSKSSWSRLCQLYRGSPNRTNFGYLGRRVIMGIVLARDWFSTKTHGYFQFQNQFFYNIINKLTSKKNLKLYSWAIFIIRTKWIIYWMPKKNQNLSSILQN